MVKIKKLINVGLRLFRTLDYVCTSYDIQNYKVNIYYVVKEKERKQILSQYFYISGY